MADLEDWTFTGTALAVVGHPIGHSLSPAMHNAALLAMGEKEERFKSWEYFRFDISPERLSEAIALFHSRKFKGLNLTIPHKVEILKELDWTDPKAKRMGAANTLLWKENGYEGYNSDGFGLERALEVELDGNLKDEKVILLGAGGAGRAAAVQCLESGCGELWIGNRSASRLDALLEVLREVKGFSRIRRFALDHPPADLPKRAILLNATSLGLNPKDPAPLELDRFDARLKVFDMVYNPSETRLLKSARARGMRAANGLSMLVWQGVRSLRIWSGAEVPGGIMEAAAREAAASP